MNIKIKLFCLKKKIDELYLNNKINQNSKSKEHSVIIKNKKNIMNFKNINNNNLNKSLQKNNKMYLITDNISKKSYDNYRKLLKNFGKLSK